MPEISVTELRRRAALYRERGNDISGDEVAGLLETAAEALSTALKETAENFCKFHNWREAYITPLYGEDLDADGPPELVLCYSKDHALRQARVRWPMARAWKFIGFADPENVECVLDGQTPLIQRLMAPYPEKTNA